MHKEGENSQNKESHLEDFVLQSQDGVLVQTQEKNVTTSRDAPESTST